MWLLPRSLPTIELLITPIPAPEENERHGRRELGEALGTLGIATFARIRTLDAAGAGGTYLGEVLRIAPTAISVVGAVLGVWIRARLGRKLTVHMDKRGVTIEAHSAADVEKVLKALKDVASRDETE